MSTPSPTPNARSAATWLRRAGIAGFLFFFLKGMTWLVLGVVFTDGCIADIW